MTKLELLCAQKAEKFASICSLVARELGYGELSTISEADRDQVKDEAEQYVELWGETVEMKTSPTIRPMTPLRRLLSEHQNLYEKSSMSVKSRSVSGPTKDNLRSEDAGRFPSSQQSQRNMEARRLATRVTTPFA